MSPVASAVAASLASGGVESVGFLNDIVAQLWGHIAVAGSNLLKDILEPMFDDIPLLSSLRFTKIDLGTTPVTFDNIDVHRRAEGVIKLDVDVRWDSLCDIELKHALAAFGVEHVKLSGRMSVLLAPLVERLPLVTAVQVAFINPPELELDFTGLANLADFSLIDDSIRKLIDGIIASILVLPNRLLIKIDPANDFHQTVLEQLGTLRLTVVKGAGFVTPKGFIKDVPDVYLKTRMGASEIWKTSTIDNSITPEWNESKDFLLSDHDQRISIEALDDDLAGDDEIGKGSITVGQLLLAGGATDLPLFVDKADTGAKISLKCTIMKFVPDLTSFEQPEYHGKDAICGLVTILVVGATGLPFSKEDASSYVKVTFGTFKFQTPMILNFPGVDCLNPPYDSQFRVPLNSELTAAPSDFCFTLMNKSKKLGTVTVPWADAIQAEGYNLKGTYKLDNGVAISLGIRTRGVHVA